MELMERHRRKTGSKEQDEVKTNEMRHYRPRRKISESSNVGPMKAAGKKGCGPLLFEPAFGAIKGSLPLLEPVLPGALALGCALFVPEARKPTTAPRATNRY
ncbi:SRY-box 15 [Anopheles sinensis]|uniref:SRY-box 15 n=1 Tax=Anopheles sinensis TaxID=74873 RepID=A0A084W109_ANOSI|nr:SRY-box 15 [Anopheles sinensis]